MPTTTNMADITSGVFFIIAKKFWFDLDCQQVICLKKNLLDTKYVHLSVANLSCNIFYHLRICYIRCSLSQVNKARPLHCGAT